MADRKTPTELGITEHEYDALVWVRDALDPDIPDRGLPRWITFEMNSWGTLTTSGGRPDPICGTECCIGGSMQMYMAGLTSKAVEERVTEDEFAEFSMLHEFSRALDGLFFDYNSGPSRNDRRLAVAAINRFLGGETRNPWLIKEEDLG